MAWHLVGAKPVSGTLLILAIDWNIINKFQLKLNQFVYDKTAIDNAICKMVASLVKS